MISLQMYTSKNSLGANRGPRAPPPHNKILLVISEGHIHLFYHLSVLHREIGGKHTFFGGETGGRKTRL